MRSVELPQGTLEYDVSGSGPTVVLLHGLLMDHTMWDQVLPRLPEGFRYLRPLLPLGSHRVALRPDADLSLLGLNRLVADFLEALDLDDVTLVHTDWGGAIFLTAHGLDRRVARLVMLPCEAFENFPPGLPGRMATLAARLPGGIQLACRQLRVGWLQRLPMLYGQMTRDPVPAPVMRRWTEPTIRDAGVRRDLLKYARQPIDRAALVRDTEALRDFGGDALVLWSPDNKVMPPEHGRRLADLMPAAQYAEVPNARVLLTLDEPALVAEELGAFLQGQPTDEKREKRTP